MNDTPAPWLPLLEDLVRRPSVSPDDAGCQPVIAERLRPLGFDVEALPFGDVENLWARRGSTGPLFVFLGHTDVVGPGPLEAWRYPPFEPTVEDGVLYGRGTADMKGGIVAFLVALERFLARVPEPTGSIALLITSDEEAAAKYGTRRVMQHFSEVGIQIDHCLVGEPSSLERLGDVVRIGRRGSLRGELVVHGIQGHIAYPHLADNPVHALAPALAELCATVWDEGNEHFPPTSFQVSRLESSSGSVNVIPGRLEMSFNFRYGTASTESGLRSRVDEILARHGVKHELRWHLSGEPFLTPGGALVEAVTAAVTAETGIAPTLDTGGGTSDGRFVAPTGAAVVELGPINASIHKVDEHVNLADLEALSRVYEGILDRLLGSA
jgi:succinyl-diaminopimelate desuccinylase